MNDALHIGQPKCASTYMQRVGLASHPGIDLVWDDHKRLFFQLADYGFDFDIEAFKRAVANTPLKNPKPGATKRVFSHESLCGTLTGAHARQIADLCYQAFGGIKAFVIVREPYSMLYSCWNQYVQEGGVLSLHDFLNSRSSPAQPTFVNSNNLWKKVQYHRLIHYWMSLVGEDRFRVFLLEDLFADSEGFHAALYDFIGVDPRFHPEMRRDRTGYPYAVARMKRFANRLTKTAGNPAGLLPPVVHSEFRLRFNQLAKRWPRGQAPDVRRHVPGNIRSEIVAANRDLAALLGRDLASLGYDV